jgi:hypothetical protein
MPINQSTPATVIVAGYAENIREQRTKEGNKLYAHDLRLQTESDGRLGVRVWLRDGDGAIPLPSVGEFVVYVAQVVERRDQQGTLRAELSAVRVVTRNDVDLLVSFLGAAKA